MIKFENVNVTIQEKRILSDVNLEIQDGEFVLICGESGCGKTTMTTLINGLISHQVVLQSGLCHSTQFERYALFYNLSAVHLTVLLFAR